MKSGKSFLTVEIDAFEAMAVYSKLLKQFDSAKRKKYNEAGTMAARDSVQSYYVKQGRFLWVTPSLGTHGPGRQATRWADNVATGWRMGNVTGSGSQIKNVNSNVTGAKSAIGLSHKVTGGTITAKRAKFLTIPLIPQAHGRRARDFSRTIGKLFAAKGCLMWKKDDGTILPAYKLTRSITQKPWTGALPPDALISNAFVKEALDAIDQDFSKI